MTLWFNMFSSKCLHTVLEGDVAQLVEPSLSVQEVSGSNPGGPNKRNFSLPSNAGSLVAV